jgi:large subunit ribosomal protein L22
VLRAIANEGPRMKRIRPAPMGRAYRYQRRMAHIEITLAEKNRNGASVQATGEAQAAAPARKPARRPVAKKKSPAKKTAGKGKKK